MNQNQIEEADFSEITETSEMEAAVDKMKEDGMSPAMTSTEIDEGLTVEELNNTETNGAAAFSRDTALAALAEAFNNGSLNKAQVREIRNKLGISQGYFTRKQTTTAQRKSKRKSQKAARKVNRKK